MGRPRIVAAALAASSLAACQGTTVISGCPPLIDYSAETQRAAAAELRRLPAGSPLARLIIDYSKMRAACRG